MVGQSQILVSANTSSVEGIDQQILKLAKSRNCLTLETCAAILDSSFPAIAGRLLALTNKGLLVKSGSRWYQPPDGYDYTITSDDMLHGKTKLQQVGCKCPDWLTHVCAMHLMDHWAKLFERCSTIDELQSVGEQIKRIPLDAQHASDLRIAYKIQRGTIARRPTQ